MKKSTDDQKNNKKNSEECKKLRLIEILNIFRKHGKVFRIMSTKGIIYTNREYDN